MVKQDLEERGHQPSHTEVVQLDVELLSAEHNFNETLVSLRFHGQMREDDAQTAQPFEEVCRTSCATGMATRPGDWRVYGRLAVTIERRPNRQRLAAG